MVVLCGLPLVSRLLRGNLCVQWIKTDKLELGREAACDLAPRAGAEGGAGKRDNNNVWPAKWRLLLFSAVTHHLPLFIIVITPWKKCKTGRAPSKAKRGGGRSNMRNGLSKEERETQEGGADGRWRGRRTASLISAAQHLQL